jgi:lysophospholipase L1-like esterase
VALGDSVTFGYQEQNVVPAPNYHRASTFVGYPEQLGAALHLKVTNLACPGETSTSLITAKDSLACENLYRKDFPLHVQYKGPQLTYAVSFLRRHPGVRLVSLAIGPNDAFRCQGLTPDDCRSPAEQRALFSTLRQNIKQILSTIRDQAHYAGQLAIVNYYSLDYSQPSVDAQSQKLNRTVDAAAKPFGAEVADGYSAFKSASFRFGDKPCLAGLLTELNSQPGNCGIHPSYAGQALLAQAVLKAIRVSNPA